MEAEQLTDEYRHRFARNGDDGQPAGPIACTATTGSVLDLTLDGQRVEAPAAAVQERPRCR